MLDDRYGQCVVAERYQDVSWPVAVMAKCFAAAQEVAAHSHPRGQLIYSLTGAVRVTTAEGVWTGSALRGIWMPPHIRHQVNMIGDVDMRTAYVCREYCAQLPDAVFMVDVNPLLRELIVRASEIPFDHDMQSHAGRLAEAIAGEISLAPMDGPLVRLPKDPRLFTICQALQLDPGNSDDFEEWARKVGASPRTLNRLFHDETGATFTRWREHVRVAAALEKLARGVSLARVAHEVGYGTVSAFAAMFKRVCGHSPKSRRSQAN